MRTQHWAFLGILLLFLGLNFEDPVKKRVADQLAHYNKVLPQEKVYLHLDKPYYHPGDTIWFKAYLIDAMTYRPDLVSKVLYVDLIDESHGRSILSKVLKVENGFANGNFDLPDLLKDGNYQVRAYTNWLRNFPESLFFMKDIRIYTDIDRTYNEEKISQLISITDLQFFPEGGDLVSGLTSRVAFKATNVGGQGTDVAGFILNSKKDTVTAFRSTHLGMGYFNFKPVSGETYIAYGKDSRGAIKSFRLPQPLDEGFVIGTDNISRKDELKVFISHNFTGKKNITLIAQQRETIRYAVDLNDTKNSFFLRIPTTNFPDDGVVQITLFDDKRTPRCERLVYINTGKGLQAEINTDKKEYAPREKVQMEIVVKDAEGKPVQGNFSLAVTDENQILHEPNGENIVSFLQLSSEVAPRNSSDSDIKRVIEQPAYYFDKINTKAPTYLDMLLMTQGWRRFKWDEVLNKTDHDTTFVIEPGLVLSGKVTQQNGNVPKQPLNLSFMITSDTTQSQFVQTESGKNGKFFFNDLNFNDSVTIAGIQMQKEKKLKFSFDETPSPPVVKRKDNVEALWIENSTLKNYLLRERQAAEYKRANDVRMLEEVTVKGARIVKTDNRKTLLSGNRSANILKVSQESCGSAISAFQLLQAKIAGVTITGTAGNYSAMIRSPNSFTQSSEPLYLIDGIPVDAGLINSLTPCEIESIEVFKGSVAIYGSRGSNGVIAFYLRTASSSTPGAWETSTKFAKLVRVGYSSPREFYSPRHDRKNGAPDLRSTVYWQPYVISNAEGKATVTFWNSDEPDTDMKIVLEGMSYDGKMIAVSSTYPVH